jgi:hypothetical protein
LGEKLLYVKEKQTKAENVNEQEERRKIRIIRIKYM